jgi:signal transduction histidine kinase
MPRFLICISVCLFFTGCLFAQQLSFNTYTPADGLTDARVQKIFQDSRGVLYFLTRDGFCSFDGQRFQNFTQYQNQPLSVVNDIVEEKKGRLLISALSGMYWLNNNQLQKDTQHFKALREPGSIIPAGSSQWIILSNTGAFIYSNGITKPALAGTSNHLTLLPDKALATANWIIGTQQTPGTKKYTLFLYNRLQQQLTTTLTADTPFDISRYQQSIYIKKNNEWQLLDTTTLIKDQLTLNPLPFAHNKNVHFFFVDQQYTYWLGGEDQSLCAINPTAFTNTCYTTVNGLPAAVSGMFQDAENNYWFMVQGKGVYKLVQSRIEPMTDAGRIQGINRQPDGTITFRSADTIGLLRKGSYNKKIFKPGPDVLQVFFRNNKLQVLYANGSLGYENGGSIRFASFEEGSKLISSQISFDSKNRLLTAGHFFAVFTGDSLTASTPLSYFTDNIAADDADNYWCFARNGDIVQYQLTGTQLVQKIKFTDNTYSTRYTLHWNKDTFCIGTRNSGIVFVKANSTSYKKLFTINSQAGLSNNFISGLLKINKQQLLTATVAGLDMVHLSVADTSAEQLFSRTGLFTGVPALVRRDDSTVIAITDEGTPYLVHLYTAINTINSPSCYFSRITVNGAAIDTTLQTAFTYNQNNFRFSVSAPSFIDEKNIRFIFHLEGSNKTATQNSRSGDFEISNLPAGNYTLTVTILLPGNNTISKTISYSFRIKKPFWKTAGFIIGLFLLATLVVYGIFRNVLRNKLERQKIELEKQEAIARERTRIATDMHDDLGAGISTIKYLSQSAPFISPAIQKENNLKIAAQADDLVDKMNDIIWAMNEKNDTLDNLVFYTKAWVANYAEQHNLAVTITIPPAVPSTIIRGEKRQHIFLCIKEAVHNIIKHAGATRLWMLLELEDMNLKITIKDNGSGFEVKKTVSGNGLANMQKRIQAVNGSLTIESTEGTILFFTIPV